MCPPLREILIPKIFRNSINDFWKLTDLSKNFLSEEFDGADFIFDVSFTPKAAVTPGGDTLKKPCDSDVLFSLVLYL